MSRRRRRRPLSWDDATARSVLDVAGTSDAAIDWSRRCAGCKMAHALCVCGEVTVVDVPVEIVLIQTVGETRSQSNTGALVERVLASCRSVLYDDPDAPYDPAELSDPSVDYRVVFPVSGAPVVSTDLIPEDPKRRLSLILLDTTWRRARRMSRRIPGLRRFPFVRLPEDLAPRFPLRQPTAPGQLNTAETVTWSLDLLGFDQAADALRRAQEFLFRRVLRIQGKIPGGVDGSSA